MHSKVWESPGAVAGSSHLLLYSAIGRIVCLCWASNLLTQPHLLFVHLYRGMSVHSFPYQAIHISYIFPLFLLPLTRVDLSTVPAIFASFVAAPLIIPH